MKKLSKKTVTGIFLASGLALGAYIGAVSSNKVYDIINLN